MAGIRYRLDFQKKVSFLEETEIGLVNVFKQFQFFNRLMFLLIKSGLDLSFTAESIYLYIYTYIYIYI